MQWKRFYASKRQLTVDLMNPVSLYASPQPHRKFDVIPLSLSLSFSIQRILVQYILKMVQTANQFLQPAEAIWMKQMNKKNHSKYTKRNFPTNHSHPNSKPYFLFFNQKNSLEKLLLCPYCISKSDFFKISDIFSHPSFHSLLSPLTICHREFTTAELNIRLHETGFPFVFRNHSNILFTSSSIIPSIEVFAKPKSRSFLNTKRLCSSQCSPSVLTIPDCDKQEVIMLNRNFHIFFRK